MKADKLKKQFGRRVRVLCKLRDITQEQLAGAVNCSTEYISRIERGLVSPSFGMIAKLAKALDAEPKDFFDFSQLASTCPHSRRKI